MTDNTNCNPCNSCTNCISCNYCNYCCYCKNLKMTEYNIFCHAEDIDNEDSFQQKRCRAFNQEVGEERYNDIVKLIKSDILKDLKLELKDNSWLKEWEKVTSEQWSRMQNEIPEFDQGIVEKITGIKIKLEVNGKKVSRDLKN